MNLKEKINKLEITNKFLAKKCNVGLTMMSFYVTGVRPIPEDVEKRINDIIKQIENIK